MLSDVISKGTGLIAALDASFMTRSGKKTDGPGKFWRGCTARLGQGLELSLLSVIDLQSNTAYALDAKQTIDEEDKTRVDLYGEQVVKLAKNILEPGSLTENSARREKGGKLKIKMRFTRRIASYLTSKNAFLDQLAAITRLHGCRS